MNYSISGWVQTDTGLRLIRVTLNAMLAEYERLGIAVPAYLASFLKNGMRYSNEDFDVLGAVMREFGVGAWERLGTPCKAS